MQHLRFRDFVRKGEECHFARVHLTSLHLPPHDHDFYEVFWVEAGRGWHPFNGRKQELRPGNLVLIRAADRHAVFAQDGKGIRIVNVAFQHKTWRCIHGRYFSGAADPFERPGREREFLFTGSSTMRMKNLARHFETPRRTPVQIDGFLLELGNFLLSGRDEPPGERMPGWLARAYHDIRSPERLAGGTREFAKLAGRSADHVAREAKRWLNKTPTGIVNDARMEYAAARLVSSEEPILNIALECGLNNLAHFYLLFRNHYHTTPRHYRLQERRITGGG